MKRKFVKAISCLLVAALVLSLLNGCYKNSAIDNENNNSDLNNEDYNSVTEVVEEKPIYHKTEVPSGYIGIYTVDDLDYIKSSPQYNYILMNDLNFDDYNSEWDEYDLKGIFDGNNLEL